MLNALSVALLQGFDPGAAAGLGCAVIAFILLFGLALLGFTIFCLWRIFAKAGYNGAMAFLVLIPGVGGLIVLLILAFGEWPIHKK